MEYITKSQMIFFTNHKIPLPYVNPRKTPRGIAQGIINYLKTDKDSISKTRVAKYRKLVTLLEKLTPNNRKVTCIKIDSEIKRLKISSSKRAIIPLREGNGRLKRDKTSYCKRPKFYFKIYTNGGKDNSGWEYIENIFPTFKF